SIPGEVHRALGKSRKEDAMMTFDLADVHSFTADLDARMERCDNGEGMYCATIDATLEHYAKLCCEFTERVRQWGREIFAGRVAFDPEVEAHFRKKGEELHSRAERWFALGYEDKDDPCYDLGNLEALEL